MTISEKAALEITRLCAECAKDGDVGLRVSVSKGGCAGFQYNMELSESKPGDSTFREHGATVHIAPDSLPYLADCALDYEDSLSDSGFRIHNKRATRTCGCGTSFEPLSQGTSASP
jgi:iron-sulfur cluster assembly protein